MESAVGTSRGEHNKPKDDGAVRGRFDITYHYEMASDVERVGRFREAIRRTCKDKTVLEVGYGTGVLTRAALPIARHVYAVELDRLVHRYARENLLSGPDADKVTLIAGDIYELVGDKSEAIPWGEIDVVVAELLSTGMVNENQVPVMQLLEDVLRPDCLRIPQRVVSLVEGVEADFAANEVEVRSYYYEFTGIRRARTATESRCFDDVDFQRALTMHCDVSVEVPVLVPSTINAARFSSIVSLVPGVNFFSTDSLMPTVICPLDEAVEADAGDTLVLRIRFRYNTDWPSITLTGEIA